MQLSTFRTSQGMMASDSVSTDELAIDIGTNPTLAKVLFEPEKQSFANAAKTKRGSPIPWPIWAGVGSVVVGGVLTAILVKRSDQQSTVKRIPNDTGTVVVHF
jgi:hypothetical protein